MASERPVYGSSSSYHTQDPAPLATPDDSPAPLPPWQAEADSGASNPPKIERQVTGPTGSPFQMFSGSAPEGHRGASVDESQGAVASTSAPQPSLYAYLALDSPMQNSSASTTARSVTAHPGQATKQAIAVNGDTEVASNSSEGSTAMPPTPPVIEVRGVQAANAGPSTAQVKPNAPSAPNGSHPDRTDSPAPSPLGASTLPAASTSAGSLPLPPALGPPIPVPPVIRSQLKNDQLANQFRLGELPGPPKPPTPQQTPTADAAPPPRSARSTPRVKLEQLEPDEGANRAVSRLTAAAFEDPGDEDDEDDEYQPDRDELLETNENDKRRRGRKSTGGRSQAAALAQPPPQSANFFEQQALNFNGAQSAALSPDQYQALQRQIADAGSMAGSIAVDVVASSSNAAAPPRKKRAKDLDADVLDSDDGPDGDAKGKKPRRSRASGGNPVACDFTDESGKVCGTVFQRPYDLARHKDTKHGSRVPKPNTICDRCGKSFSRKDALLRHKRQNKCNGEGAPYQRNRDGQSTSVANGGDAGAALRHGLAQAENYVEQHAALTAPPPHLPLHLDPAVAGSPMPTAYPSQPSTSMEVGPSQILSAVRAAHAIHATHANNAGQQPSTQLPAPPELATLPATSPGPGTQ